MDRRTASGMILAVWVAVSAAALPASFGQEPPAVPPPAPRAAGWLGVWLTDAVDGGVQVVALWPGGPAERSGLRAGDTLIEAGGQPVGDREDLAQAIARRGPGDELPVVVLRGSGEHRVLVTLGAKGGGAQRPTPRPPGAPTLEAWSEIGLEVESMTAALRSYLGAPENAGVLVTRVEAGRAADRAGLRVGDVLVRLGDEEIASAGEVRVTLMPWRVTEPLQALVVREQKPVRLELRATASEGPRAEPLAASQETVRRRIEAEIRRLERRIAELRQEIEDLESAD